MVTPFHNDGSIDIDSAVKLAKKLVEQGNDGLVLNGTTGESPTTHAPEKSELIAAVVEAVGSEAYVVAGAGSNDTAHAIRMAKQAEEAGADGLLVVTPYYSRPSQRGVVAHIEAIADSTELPVMLYDIPGRTGVRISTESYIKLAQHEKIIAVKDATGDVSTAAVNIAATDLVWYSGDDGLYLPFLSIGAVGLVSVVAHVASQDFASVGNLFHEGNHKDALKIAQKLQPLTDAVMSGGQGAVIIKAALKELGVIETAVLRAPQANPDEAEIADIRSALSAYGLL